MSSSEPSLGRFYAAFGAMLIGALTLLALVLVVVDPLGATAGNALCRAGAKGPNADDAREFIAHRTRPRIVVLGSSRVQWGFAADALERLGPDAVNLGIGGGLPADFAALADEALAAGRLERVFIGVDFNSLHQVGGRAPARPAAMSPFPELERWRRAFLIYPALRAVPGLLLDCRPKFTPDGAPVLDAAGHPLLPSPEAAADRVGVAAALARLPRPDPQRFASRMGELRALIRRLRRHDVEVVLFSAPYREELLEVFGKVGLRDDFDAFHTELARLAREEGVPLVDLHSPQAVATLNLPPCPDGGIGCHYLDLTHYSPLVGRQIAAQLAAARP
jgi:lysophospholipase L1-like esterase